jgi:hypothetical protein
MSREELRNLTDNVRSLRLQLEDIKQDLRRQDKSPPLRNTPTGHQQFGLRGIPPPTGHKTAAAHGGKQGNKCNNLIYVSIHTSVVINPSIHPSIHPSIYPSMHTSNNIHQQRTR